MDDVYKLLIAGIAIFSFQQVLVELWIKPLTEFKAVLSRVDSFLIKYAYLSQVVWGQNEVLDIELHEGKDKMREYAGELGAKYSGLPYFEKMWIYKVRKINVIEGQKELIKLSNLIGQKTEGVNLRVLASNTIDKIRRVLGFHLG